MRRIKDQNGRTGEIVTIHFKSGLVIFYIRPEDKPDTVPFKFGTLSGMIDTGTFWESRDGATLTGRWFDSALDENLSASFL